MKKKRILIIFALCPAIILLSACELPSKNPTTSPADSVFQTAQAAADETLTQQANLVVPSLTASPAFTITVAPPEITSAPPISSKPMVSVSKESNCRVGTGTSFERVGGLLPGVTAELIGFDTSGNYLYIRNPQNQQGFCWIIADFTTIVGDSSNLPRFTPMPTPTITITPTLATDFSFITLEIDGCVGSFVEVSVKNTGSIVWSSGSVISKDTVSNVVSTEQNFDDLREVSGCTFAGPAQTDLDPGETGFMQGQDLTPFVPGNQILVTVKLCTQDLLAGTCITKETTFTP